MSLSLPADAKQAVRTFWPLAVGKRASFELRHADKPDDRTEVSLEVTGTERGRFAGRDRDVFVVRAKASIYAYGEPAGLETVGYPTTTYEPPPYRYEQTWRYDPVEGIVVSSELVWPDFPIPGYGYKYELVKATFPDSPVVAAARAG